ncbi:uncharacterized protein AC631_00308 [Debaryomyces fabryi]|uniref:Genetic interactor of prohibitin 5, mitochondrial n=1 Tax=Debaryomyces fabryi TaxID=58627 RepID=A0A0V1Q5X5_9ASCO|nr:uncharacterized protein AC631_00308 [Debaryomyces fabryi]KSA03853.1 hypothetical protein AC631_00308 [Debaryomyces fabryi]CUM48665.1 unnamed protein product [Debaryomyces fabryi]
MGLSIRQYYKQICRRIHRLPLDHKTIECLRLHCKSKFVTQLKKGQYQHTSIDKSSFDKGIKVLDDVLVNENYDSLNTILDFIYKEALPQPQWVSDFMKYKYTAFRPCWPQVHLFNELTTTPKQSKLYEEALEKDKDMDLSLVSYFGIKPASIDTDLKPLKLAIDKTSPVSKILLEFKKLHSFVFRNQEKLTHLKVQPLEVIYPANRFGLPIHVTQRDKLLKQKVNYAKSLCQEFKPIYENSLNHLVEFAIYKPGSTKGNDAYKINENFFKYMIRKHNYERDNLNPLYKHHLRNKKLIPNDNNIRKYMREYVRKQFYYDSKLKTYKMCWMQNFYENEKRIVPGIEIPS